MQKVSTTKIKLYIPTANDQFYAGCMKYGRDADGILRVSKTKWTPECKYDMYATHDKKKAEDLLAGILKYDSSKGIKYNIAIVSIDTKVKVNIDY